MMELNLKKFYHAVDDTEPIKMSGKVTQVIGLVIESKGPKIYPLSVGISLSLF